MLGLSKTAEQLFASAMQRYRKLNEESAQLVKAEITAMRRGEDTRHFARDAEAMKQAAFRAMMSDLDKAIAKKPDYVEALFNKGCLHQMAGEHSAASSCYARVLQLQPAHANALFCAAQVKKAVGQPQEALAYYRRAVECNPGDADAWYEMGLLLAEVGDAEASRQARDRALALNPPNLRVAGGSEVYVGRPRLFSQ